MGGLKAPGGGQRGVVKPWCGVAGTIKTTDKQKPGREMVPFRARRPAITPTAEQPPHMNAKSLLTFTLGTTVGLASLAAAPKTSAFTYVETGDAGQTLATAAGPASSFAGQPLNAIVGSVDPAVNNVYDADLYKIFITNTSTFSATTVGGSSLDTSLFLFDLNGRAIIANDDAGGNTFQSTLPVGTPTLTALGVGTYYLGIALSGAEAINSVNQLLFTQVNTTSDLRTAASGVNPATLATFDNGVFFNESGSYVINLTSATAVPEPSTWALTGAGALALGAVLSRRRRALAV